VQRDENGIATMRSKARATRGDAIHDLCRTRERKERKGERRGEGGGGVGVGRDLLNLPKD
jgi:hypothetical protein